MADVGCAGILVADTFCGPMKQLPVEGELLAIDEMPAKAGGCAANVAIDLAKQGFSVDVCGCVGADASAEVILQSMAAAGVDWKQVSRLSSQTTSKTVILLVEGEDRRYIHVFGANAAFTVQQIQREWIDTLKVFYLGGLFAMPGIDTGELIDLLGYCRQRDVVTVVDVVVPQGDVDRDALRPLLPHVDYFLPNDDEARRLTGLIDTEQQVEFFLRHGAKTVVITCGTEGAVAASGSDRWQGDICRVRSIDPSGSGDAFASGIVTGVLHRWDMARTLRYAAALGASATMAVGTTEGVFNAREAEAFLQRHPLSIRHFQGNN